MKKFKSIGFALMYLAIAFCLQFLMGFVMSFQMIILKFVNGAKFDPTSLQKYIEKDSTNLYLVALINFIIIVGYGLWYFFIRRREEKPKVDYKKIVSPKSLLCILGLAVSCQFLCGIIMVVLQHLMPSIYDQYLKLAEGLQINVLPAWLMIFIVVIWSPLAEELIFRAMIFRTLRKGFPFAVAAIISGAMFGIYHLNVVQGIYAGLFGVVLAYVYEKTNSLLGCYLFHLFFNLSSYLIEGMQSGLHLSDGVMGVFSLLMMVFSFLLFFPLCMYLAKRFAVPKPQSTIQEILQDTVNPEE